MRDQLSVTLLTSGGAPGSRLPKRSGRLFAKRRRGKKPGDQTEFCALRRRLADLFAQAPRNFAGMPQITAREQMRQALDILIGQF